MRNPYAIFTIALIAVGVAAPAEAKRMDPVLLQGEARAIDGDTLQVGDTRLRLHGIDAPELRQTCEDNSGEAWACGRRLRRPFRLAQPIPIPPANARQGRIVCAIAGRRPLPWIAPHGSTEAPVLRALAPPRLA